MIISGCFYVRGMGLICPDGGFPQNNLVVVVDFEERVLTGGTSGVSSTG